MQGRRDKLTFGLVQFSFGKTPPPYLARAFRMAVFSLGRRYFGASSGAADEDDADSSSYSERR